MNKYIIVVLLLLLGLNVARAECHVNGCIGPAADTFPRMFLDNYPNEGTAYIRIEAPPESRSKLNCTLHAGLYLSLANDGPLFRETYATILASMVTNKSLFVRIIEGSPDCKIHYIRFDN